MDEKRHTPGPWALDATGDMGWWEIGTADRPIATIETDEQWGSEKENKANARLISAAPELYREAIRVVEWLERLAVRADGGAKDTRFKALAEASAADAKNYRASVKGLKAAIAKAEGR